MGTVWDALNACLQDPRWRDHITAVHRLPGRPPRFGPWPPALAAEVRALCQRHGIDRLYTHQSAAVRAALAGQDVLVVTPTASGKSLVYWVLLLHTLITHPTARALCLFPTKALSQDQYHTLRRWLEAWGHPEWVGIYDGDTPVEERRQVRRNARVLITNPDMLHRSLLPQHTRWAHFWRDLRWVVMDEVHAYRGIFGAHVANVLRRLQRVATFHGASPYFLGASATVGNPGDLVRRLWAREATLVQENGAPQPPRVWLFYNPPLLDPALGLRQPPLLAAAELANHFLEHGVQTLVFTRSRQGVELLLTYVREHMASQGIPPEQVRGYRGGYLPQVRRDIERGLRAGTVRGVVATNALELGIDIGTLEAVLVVGYPGSRASLWQQWGRAGRRNTGGVGVFIAGSSALDQYLVQHPEFLLKGTPEHALLAPDNLHVVVDHLRCALFELPMAPDETFGTFTEVAEVLAYLTEEGEARRAGGRYYWLGQGYPAEEVSLRTASPHRVRVQVMGERPQLLGEVDWETAPRLVHPEAIYLHEGKSYYVRHVDWDAGIAQVEPVTPTYYTQPLTREELTVLNEWQRQEERGIVRAWGEVRVRVQVTGYRRVRWLTHEVLGYGEVSVPPREMETTAYWLAFTEEALDYLRQTGVWRSDPVLDYGPNWEEQRRRALARDGYRCRRCGVSHQPRRPLHVHHVRPFRTFGYVPGENDAYLEANRLENLITLCARCHRLAEAGVRLRTGFNGMAYAVRALAPLFLMTDPGDLGMVVETQSPHTGLPTLTLYDNVPGGIGLAERLYEVHWPLIRAARARVQQCPCRFGCPACVGPVLVDTAPDGSTTKALTLALLDFLLSSTANV